MAIRRHCDPINVKQIWDAIRLASASHQSCDLNRILKYFQKTNDCTQEQVELYINQCVKDGLIMLVYQLLSYLIAILQRIFHTFQRE